MDVFNAENMRIAQYGVGGVVGLIGASYLSTYLKNNVYELIGGAALIGGSFVLIKGTDGFKGPLKLALSVAGLIFLIRGLLGFVPEVSTVVAQYTMNVL